MAGRFFLPAVFLRGGKVLMKKREWKGKEEVIKTKDSVKKTPTGAKNKAFKAKGIGFVSEGKRKNGSYSEGGFGRKRTVFWRIFIGKENRISAFLRIAPKQATVKNHSLFCM